MKNLLTGLFIGLIVGIIISFWAGPKLAGHVMFVVDEAPFSFEETNQRFVDAVEAEAWSIQKVYDLQASMEKHGYEVNPVNVYSLCKPEHAYKILKSNEERVVTTMMPCRVAIYKNDNGKTYIARINSELLAGQIGGLVEEVMTAAATDNEQIISNTLK